MASLVMAEPPATPAAADKPPAIPATPAAVDDLVYARSFTLEKGYRFTWSKERPLLTSGTLLVLQVDPALVFPRQEAEPVLYAGNQTAERVNCGHKSGHVIAIVPGDVHLAKTPIWFGTPGFPERVDANTVQAERASADEAKIEPFSAEQVQAARAEGGEPVRVADVEGLLRDYVAPLILEYSPDEKRLADAFRVPITRK
jgi:hypothetical protein